MIFIVFFSWHVYLGFELTSTPSLSDVKTAIAKPQMENDDLGQTG